MTKINTSMMTQEQMDNWQDPMTIGMQQGPKQIGIAGISPLPGLINQHYNPLDMGKYEGNPNHNPVYQNFMDSEFNIPGAGGMAMTEVFYGDDQSQMFGDTHSAGQFRQYLESIGLPINQNPNIKTAQPFIPDDSVRDNSNQVKIAPGNPGLVDRPGGEVPPPITAPSQPISIMPTLPDYTDKFSGYDTKIGGFDNQFKDIIGRLDKLEQGIGSMANTNVPAPTPVQGGVPSVYTGNNARGY